MYLNRMGLRAIERANEKFTTLLKCTLIREVATTLPDAPQVEDILEITESDELPTFVASKQNKYRLGRQGWKN